MPASAGSSVFSRLPASRNFAHVDENDLRQALPILAKRNVPLLVHAETPALLKSFSAAGPPAPDPPVVYPTYLATRPPEAEVDAIRMMIRLAEEFAVLTHIVHVSAEAALEDLARAQSDGVPVTAETCPHYLTFAAEEIPDGATEFKCAPPIRDASNRDALWNGLQNGVLDLVVTDHSPSPAIAEDAGRLHARVGRDRVARAVAGGGLDRGIGARLRPGRHRAAG